MGWLRHPKTTNEKRQWHALEFERSNSGYKVRARARRSWKRLVDTWDDIMNSSIDIKSWKRYRKNQWKPVGE